MEMIPWNPWFGCSQISPSCEDCHVISQRFSVPGELDGLVDITAAGTVFNGKLRFNDEQMRFPNLLETGAEISVLPHSDLFHENAPASWIDYVFDVMENDTRHLYQVLTKRSARMLCYLRDRYRGAQAPCHIAIGVSVEEQAEADRRISDLANAPASFKWLAFFALREPIDLFVIPDVDEHHLMAIHRVLLAGSLKNPNENPAWYKQIAAFFEGIGVMTTFHNIPDEIENRRF